MSEVERTDDARARFSLRVWKPIVVRALANRGAVAGLLGAGLAIAVIETALPLFVRAIIDEANEIQANGGASAALAPILVVYSTLFLFFAAGVWLFIDSAGGVATRTGDRLRRDCFAKLQTLEPAYFDVRPTGWLVSRLTSDCTKVSSILPWCMLDFAWCTAILTGVTITMFVIDARLALWALAVVPVMAVVCAVFQRFLMRAGREARRLGLGTTADLLELEKSQRWLGLRR